MNIEDALLTRRLLKALEGSIGKSHDQLAKECQVGRRRMTNLVFCLEKAGLITTHDTGVVTLSGELAHLVLAHANRLLIEEIQAGPAFKGWENLLEGVRLSCKKAAEFDLSGIFNEIFGGKK